MQIDSYSKRIRQNLSIFTLMKSLKIMQIQHRLHLVRAITNGGAMLVKIKKKILLKMHHFSGISEVFQVSFDTSEGNQLSYVFSRMNFLIFTNIAPLIVIALTKCSLCWIQMIFCLYFETITYTKDNFCFHEFRFVTK